MPGAGIPAERLVEQPRGGIAFKFHLHALHVLIDNRFVRDTAGQGGAQHGGGDEFEF